MVEHERRRHIRVKPTADLPARVALLGDGPLREALDVVDVSVSGFALSSPALRDAARERQLKLLVTLGDSDFAVDVIVRWTTGETAGVELMQVPSEAATTLGRYVAELLERGA